jgi:hypothetical protein
MSLSQVSKLTSTSAGWEPDLQRFLHRLGPSLLHLSLWTSETRAILRDPAQIRGPRFRNRMPIHTLNDVVLSTIKRRRKLERRLRKGERGQTWSEYSSKPLKLEKDRDERQTRAEIAAAKERAKQKMPNWLRVELESRKAEEVRRMYKAQMGPIPRQYQHELDVQMAIRGEVSEYSTDQGRPDSPTSDSDGNEVNEEDRDRVSSSDSDDDHDLDWGCMPIKLSICPALPLHEHENALNFARMTIWTRIEELDM